MPHCTHHRPLPSLSHLHLLLLNPLENQQHGCAFVALRADLDHLSRVAKVQHLHPEGLIHLLAGALE